MADTMPCPICRTISEYRALGALNTSFGVDCRLCGNYIATAEAIYEIENLSGSDRGRLSGLLWEHKQSRRITEIRKADIAAMLSQTPSDILGKLDRLLVNLASFTHNFGQRLTLDPEWRNIGYTIDSEEFKSQIRHLLERGLIREEHKTGQAYAIASVTESGLQKALEIRSRTGVTSNKAFVAMWFNKSMDGVYEDGIAKAITDCGFEAMRVDRVEHNDLIDDRIIVGLRECKFVVAEYTNHRNGVYYEAGYAHGMGKTVIMCCREEDKEGIHFDVNHRNFILYKSPEDLAEKLRMRILATVGRGSTITD